MEGCCEGSQGPPRTVELEIIITGVSGAACTIFRHDNARREICDNRRVYHSVFVTNHSAPSGSSDLRAMDMTGFCFNCFSV
jgi:hypothetical protein